MPDGNDVQETQVDETNTGTEDMGAESNESTTAQSNDGLPDDPEELKKAVFRLRRENASWRTKLRELEKNFQETKAAADSKKTDLEKLQEQVAQLAAENKRFKQLEAAKGIAKEFSLPIDLVEFVVADDEDEMRERAEKLAAQIMKSKPKATADGMGAGRRGSAPQKANAWFEALLRGE